MKCNVIFIIYNLAATYQIYQYSEFKQFFMNQQQKIQMFRSITAEETLTQLEIKRYLQWGKGDIERALNYFYHRQQKFFKNAQQSNTDTSKNYPNISNARSVVSSRVSNMNAFDVMKKAAKKQKKQDDFIKNVKEKYKLPVGKTKKPSTKQQPNLAQQAIAKQANGKKAKKPNKNDDKREAGKISKQQDLQFISELYIPNEKDHQSQQDQFQDADYISHAFYGNPQNQKLDSPSQNEENLIQQNQQTQEEINFQCQVIYDQISLKPDGSSQQQLQDFYQNLQKIVSRYIDLRIHPKPINRTGYKLLKNAYFAVFLIQMLCRRQKKPFLEAYLYDYFQRVGQVDQNKDFFIQKADQAQAKNRYFFQHNLQAIIKQPSIIIPQKQNLKRNLINSKQHELDQANINKQIQFENSKIQLQQQVKNNNGNRRKINHNKK